MGEEQQSPAERWVDYLNGAWQRHGFWGEAGQIILALATEVEALKKRVEDLERGRNG